MVNRVFLPREQCSGFTCKHMIVVGSYSQVCENACVKICVCCHVNSFVILFPHFNSRDIRCPSSSNK